MDIVNVILELMMTDLIINVKTVLIHGYFEIFKIFIVLTKLMILIVAVKSLMAIIA